MNKKLIRLTVSDTSDRKWTEDYEIGLNEDSQAWAKDTIQHFNDTLKEGEKLRTLEYVDEVGDKPTPLVDHDAEQIKKLKAYRAVSSYTISAVEGAIDELVDGIPKQQKNEFIKHALKERLAMLKASLKIIEKDCE